GLAVSVFASLVWMPAGGALDSGTPPVYQATLGGPLHAEMYPSGMEIAPDGSVVVADTGNNQVAKYTAQGTPVWRIGRHGSATGQFDNPRDADADAAGNIYVANYKVNNVVKFTATGSCTAAWGTTGTGDGQFRALYGVRLATDPVLGAQAVYVADANNNRVQEFRTDG